ncbi:hypothetical protein KAZ01_01670, partial [Candidatus Gracilibacteria bacterium]|nr:hypothetical protein [Candidatus Gracilibacteria bacterium]
MIIVPLSESANNHQYYNALEYDKKGSVVILEKDLNEIGVMEILKFEKFKKKVKEFKYNYEIVKKIAKEIKIRF